MTTDRSGSRPPRAVIKRSVMIAGHKTSLSMEEQFWSALHDIANTREESVNALVNAVDDRRGPGTNLSSSVRIFVLQHYMALRAQRVFYG